LRRIKPYFLAATAACLGGGYWLRHRLRKAVCATGDACGRPLPNRAVTIGLILATVLVVGALTLDLLAPFLSNG